MKSRTLLAAGTALMLALSATGPGQAQSNSVDEIVVTGSKLNEYDATETPQVAVIHRADNLIIQVKVVCDTREKGQRLEELKATIRNVLKEAAKDPRIDLGQDSDEIIGGFDESLLDEMILPDGKPDSSYASFIVKTSIAKDDTYRTATGRLESFIKRVGKVGRTEILAVGGFELTLIGPAQYRPAVIAAIAEDARKSAAAFGPDYQVKAIGLEHSLAWYRAGPLDLALYIPYRLEISPLGK
ncbi:hypothetical protein QO010_003260 [Caulobacter ginsengisoli]|uniref:DUF541 domain-containing protein n=1 Tax=Caulobacter ginsengisoli TaxID=400775 RepID=A0ABU0ITZ0_9CAUL|nr:hypothetical protein [Caulobacter ginsengisoli]MDQ0465471.1 hypothetical protein [Caulobacter ginsengisoli]